MSPRRRVYVDGSNIAYPRSPNGNSLPGARPTLDNILAVDDVLHGWGTTPIILADRNLPYLIDDAPRFRQLCADGLIVVVEDRPIADLELLECAERDRAPVLSNDTFGDHLSRYPWASGCVVDCFVADRVVRLESNKLAFILDTAGPIPGPIGSRHWSPVLATPRHHGAIELARAWLESPRQPSEPELARPVELTFPEQKSVGTLYRHLNGRLSAWKLARGAVRVSHGEWLGLEVRGPGVRDLSALRRIPPDALRSLWWDDRSLTDDRQLRHIRHLSGLTDLTLSGQSVTDAGMEHVAQLLGLESLTVDYLLTDWDRSELRHSPSRLSLTGVSWLSSLARLRTLKLRGAEISKSAAYSLAMLSGLENLDLSESTLSDAGVCALSHLGGLRRLTLRATGVTDAAIDVFAQLPDLSFLDVRETRMTSAWRTRLPNVRAPGDPYEGGRVAMLRSVGVGPAR